MDTIKLPQRLLGVAKIIGRCDVLCDIGTDHGLLPIYMLQNKLCKHAIATDINWGPLKSGQNNAAYCNLSNKISFRLCAGFSEILTDEFDTAVICGMGTETICQILNNAPWVKNDRYVLVLQPMTAIHELRYYLYQNGFLILEERIVKQSGKYYTIVKVCGKCKCTDTDRCPGDFIVSDRLCKDTLGNEYYMHLYKKYLKAQKGILSKSNAGELTPKEKEILHITQKLREEIGL